MTRFDQPQARRCGLILVIVALLASGCASPRRTGSLTVDTEVDPNVSFAGYKSFQVAPSEGSALGQPIAARDRHLQNAIAQELTNKGLIRTDSRRVDLMATYRTSAVDGSIAIDLVDVSAERRVWRGVGLGWDASIEPDYDDVRERVRQILQSYPRLPSG